MSAKLNEVGAGVVECGVQVKAWCAAGAARKDAFVLGKSYDGAVEPLGDPLGDEPYDALVPVGVVEH